MSEWRIIETAPEDGTYIILFRPTAAAWMRVDVGYWDDQRFHKRPKPFWRSTMAPGQDLSRAYPPTHWQPLPEPPPEGAQL